MYFKKNYLFLILGLFFLFRLDVYADLESAVLKNTCEELIKDGTIDRENQNLLFEPTYDRNCIYYMSLENRCVLFQLSFDSSTGDYDYKALYPIAYEGKLLKDVDIFFSKPGLKVPIWGFVLDYDSVEQSDLLWYKGLCPVGLHAKIDYVGAGIYNGYFILGDSSINMSRLYATSVEIDIPALITKVDKNKIESCQDLLGDEGVKVLKLIYNIIRILIPIILLVLGTFDFVQAIFSGNEDGMKKAQTKFMRRFLLSIVIFLIPVVFRVLLNIAHSIWPVIDNSLCGILE